MPQLNMLNDYFHFDLFAKVIYLNANKTAHFLSCIFWYGSLNLNF